MTSIPVVLTDERPRLGTGTVTTLAVATGAIAANLYYVQPLLPEMSRTAGIGPSSASLITTVTQAAFALGLVFVLPVADLVGHRRLLTVLLGLNAAGLALVGGAPDGVVLLAAFTLVGVTNVAAQVIVPAAAALARDEQRGRVVGAVIGGLLTGVLAARGVAGLVSDVWGWRPLFLAAAVLMVVVLLVLRRVVPDSPVAPDRLSYPAALRATATTLRRDRLLAARSLLGGLGFAAFSLFWATMAFLLGDADHHFDSSVIGAFGLLGAAGAVAANWVGRVRDPRRAGPTALAVAVLAVSFVVLYFAPWSLVALGVGVVVLDVAVQGLHVLNQRLIYDALPQARSRANSAYMTCYFLGGALGSAAGTFAWNHYGWAGVCVTGLIIVALAVPVVPFATTAASARSQNQQVAQEGVDHAGNP